MADSDSSSPIVRYNLILNQLEYFNGSDWYAAATSPEMPVVDTINGLHGDLTLAAGSNITLTPSGNTITIAATGGGSSPSIQIIQAAAPAADQVDFTVTPGWDLGSAEGTPLSLTITPSSASATIRVSLVCEAAFAGTPINCWVTAFMDSTNLYGSSSSPAASYGQSLSHTDVGTLRVVLERYIVPGDTAAHVFTIQGAFASGSDGFSIGTGDLTFIVEEVH
jgi:hypothetical protein